MNKIGGLILILVALNLATAQILKIPIEKIIPETEENNSFLGDKDEFAAAQLINHDQLMYTGLIQLGLKNQSFSVDFDSGSNLLWLPSKNCPSCVSDGLTNTYDCKTEDGCTLTTTPAQVTYGDGSGVKGHIAKVPVSIGGAGPVTEALLLVEVSKGNKNLNSDGLMGLGVYDENDENSVSFVNKLYKQGLIQKSQFSFYLGFGKSESELSIGGVDASKLANPSQLYFHPLIINGQKNNNQRWSIAFKSVSFGNQSVAITGANTGIVDSGTSLVYIKTDVYKKWISYLKTVATLRPILSGASILQSVKCGTTLPDLTFTLTDVNGVDRSYSLPSSFYIIESNSICFIGIQPNSVSDDIQFLMGDIFMRRFVSVFDYTNLSVGLSQSVADPSTNPNQIHKHESHRSVILLASGLALLAGLVFITFKLLRK